MSIRSSGLLLVGERQRIGEDEPAFGVGVADLDRKPLRERIDVERAEGRAGDRVLDRRDSTRSRTFSLRVHDHVRQRQHARGAAHVLLHEQHGAVRLDVEAAGVEADALADQRHARWPGSPQVMSISRGARARRHGRPRESAENSRASRSSPTIDADVGAVARRERARGLREFGRPHVVRRRIDEVARQRHRLDDALEILAIDALRQIEPDLRGLPCGSG